MDEDEQRGARAVPAPLRRSGDRVAIWASSAGFARSARLVALLFTPLLLAGGPVTDRQITVFAGLATYVLTTAFARRDRFVRTADLLVAAAVIVAAGASVAAYLPFILVAIAGLAARSGPRVGSAVGMLLAALLIVSLFYAGASQDTAMTISMALLLPMVGLTTSAAVQILDDEKVRDRMALEEANRLLSALGTLADDLPGGLDTTTIGAALVSELRRIPGAGQVIVYADENGVLRPCAAAAVPTYLLGSLGFNGLATRTATGSDHPRELSQLPSALQAACAGSPWWVVRAMRDGSRLTGLLLVGFEDRGRAVAARSQLDVIASDGRLALDNARLFDGTRIRAADAARRQVAADLHDGVAQSLAHLRMELELLARHAEGTDRDEVARLGRVASTALQELRRMIRTLDTPQTGNLTLMVERHLADLRSTHGPELEIDVSGSAELEPERAEEAFRVTQEALSNALRHAEASMIRIEVELDREIVVVSVEDDGVGITGAPRAASGGIGLRSMEERAHRLGGSLELRPRLGGGTVVMLRFPTQPATSTLTR